MGTELIARGLDVRSDIAERWVLDRPEDVSAIHRGYAEAGAEVIQTCTFGALRSRLPEALRPRVREICARAVTLARQAAPGLPIVGSIGPTGSEDEVAEAARALAEAGVDALHLETYYLPDGLAAAAAGARAGARNVPLWISVTLMTGNTGLETPHGVPVARMLRALAEAAPDAVGVNCSLDADRIRGAVEQLVEAGLGPVIARPQARISEKCATGRSSERPERFAERAFRLYDLGAAAVGGCCGTSPASIAALAALRLLGAGHAPTQPLEAAR